MPPRGSGRSASPLPSPFSSMASPIYARDRWRPSAGSATSRRYILTTILTTMILHSIIVVAIGAQAMSENCRGSPRFRHRYRLVGHAQNACASLLHAARQSRAAFTFHAGEFLNRNAWPACQSLTLTAIEVRFNGRHKRRYMVFPQKRKYLLFHRIVTSKNSLKTIIMLNST